MNSYIIQDPSIWASVLFIITIMLVYYILCKREEGNESTYTLQSPLLLDVSFGLQNP